MEDRRRKKGNRQTRGGKGGKQKVNIMWVDKTLRSGFKDHCIFFLVHNILTLQGGVAHFSITEISLLVYDSSTVSAPPISQELSHQSKSANAGS